MTRWAIATVIGVQIYLGTAYGAIEIYSHPGQHWWYALLGFEGLLTVLFTRWGIDHLSPVSDGYR